MKKGTSNNFPSLYKKDLIVQEILPSGAMSLHLQACIVAKLELNRSGAFSSGSNGVEAQEVGQRRGSTAPAQPGTWRRGT